MFPSQCLLYREHHSYHSQNTILAVWDREEVGELEGDGVMRRMKKGKGGREGREE